MHPRIARLSLATLLLAASMLMLLATPARAAGEFARAQAAVEAGRLKEALPLLDAAIAAEPGRAGAYLLRGIVRVELKQWDPALADYEAALKLDPGNAEAWYRRGYWWAADAKDRKALADYARAIELDPVNARYLYARATAFERLRDLRRAAEAYQAVLMVDPGHADATRNLQGMRDQLGPAAAGVPGAAAPESVAVAPPKTPPPSPAPPVQVERDDPAVGSTGVEEPATVLMRVLTAQARGDLAALEREWDLDALGAEAARLQRARLQAVASSVRIDEFRFRERATLFSDDGAGAIVRAEVSFRAINESGESRWANGLFAVLRRNENRPAVRWVVVAVIPDELLNSEIAERTYMQTRRTSRSSGPAGPQLSGMPLYGGGAGPRNFIYGGIISAVLQANSESTDPDYIDPISYSSLNRNLDFAIRRYYTVTKLKAGLNSASFVIGKWSGVGDILSNIYQVGDSVQGLWEAAVEYENHGATAIAGLKIKQVGVGIWQCFGEWNLAADVTSDAFQFALENVVATMEIRRVIDWIKLDIEHGVLLPTRPTLRLIEGRRYPPGLQVSQENADQSLTDPRVARLRPGFLGGLVGLNMTTPDLLTRKLQRLPFEVVGQIVIDPSRTVYKDFDERAAAVVGAVQRDGQWVIPVWIGRWVYADDSTGIVSLHDYRRMRVAKEDRVFADLAATWAWQPCRGVQRIAVRVKRGDSTLPVAFRNGFMNQLAELAIVDAQGVRLDRVALSSAQVSENLSLVGIDAKGGRVNLTSLLRQPYTCVEVAAPDSGVATIEKVTATTFSIAAAASGGNDELTVAIHGDATVPVLNFTVPIEVSNNVRCKPLRICDFDGFYISIGKIACEACARGENCSACENYKSKVDQCRAGGEWVADDRDWLATNQGFENLRKIYLIPQRRSVQVGYFETRETSECFDLSWGGK